MSARDNAIATIEAYFAAFNQGDTVGMEALVSDDIEHHVNQGGIRRGRELFAEFNRHMSRCYRENLTGITALASEDGSRAAAEFTVNGEYLADDEGLPPASGQRYCLPAGTFFSLRDGKITRIATHYNLQDWIAQVGAE